MEFGTSDNDFDQFAYAALSVALSVVAIRSLQRGKRRRGALAGVGALAIGSGRLTETLGIGATDEAELRCAACGQPIRPGERRKPNEDGETVHEDCMETAV